MMSFSFMLLKSTRNILNNFTSNHLNRPVLHNVRTFKSVWVCYEEKQILVFKKISWRKILLCFSELKRRLKAEKKAKEKAEKEKMEQQAQKAVASKPGEKKAEDPEEPLTEAVSLF